MSKIRIIGDVHRKYVDYLFIVNNVEYSVQIGDMGYRNECLPQHVNCDKHKFFTGNHDNHNKDYELPNCLGRYGCYTLNGVKFFFVSGGFSIDKEYRIKQHDNGYEQTYFINEELDKKERDNCLRLYKRQKPDIVLSHECPRSIVNFFSNPDVLRNFGYNPDTFTTETSDFLDKMMSVHKPKIWFFGHYHKSWQLVYNDIKFVLLNELEFYDLDTEIDLL